MTDCADHDARLDALERRAHEQDGVMKLLRIAGLLAAIAVAMLTLVQLVGAI